MVFQTNSWGGCGGNWCRGQCPRCTYCNKLGHYLWLLLSIIWPTSTHYSSSSIFRSSTTLPGTQSPSSPTPEGVIITNSEYEVYLCAQASMFAPVEFIAQTGNASTCQYTHLLLALGFLILEPWSSHCNKDLFSFLTFTLHFLMITLANGSQIIGKGSYSICPLRSLPLSFVLSRPLQVCTCWIDIGPLLTHLVHSCPLQF